MRVLTFFTLLAALLLVSACGDATVQQQVTFTDPPVPEWSIDDIIYEVNVRQYTPDGTFNAFAEHLPRLKEMGVDILWLMPIHPIGEKNRKGTLGSYYSVKDYLLINPEMGTTEDFRALVKKAHDAGMHLILDWVPNHTAWDHRWTETNPDFYTKDSTGNFMPPIPDWADVIDLNYDNPALRDSMTAALRYWIEEFDIDGYRCDVAAMVPTDYWNDAVAELRQIKPIFMLAEAEEVDLHDEAFTMNYAWNLHHDFNAVAQGEAPASDITAQILNDNEKFPEHTFKMVFTSNHDENSWNGTVFERIGDGAETFAALSGIVPGMMLIYSGQEAGLDRRLEFFEKNEIEWKEHPFTELYTKLAAAKEDNPALWNGAAGGSFLPIENSTPDDVMTFMRIKESNVILGVFNLSNETAAATFEDVRLSGTATELFTGEQTELQQSMKVSLEPWEYHVYILN